jgi:hypothetical protein
VIDLEDCGSDLSASNRNYTRSMGKFASKTTETALPATAR